MTPGPIPVFLVHGWNSHPGIWNRLCQRLDGARIPYYRFDHSRTRTSTIGELSLALGDYIRDVRETEGYDGGIDIVCHSIGTCIARFLLEVHDKTNRNERVRRLVGVGPTNNGSAIAELFFHPAYGKAAIRRLDGMFVPEGFDPASDPIVQDVRPKSPAMQELRSAGTRGDIEYRMIVTANPGNSPAFFPVFGGRTWELAGTGDFFLTENGDGIVSHAESALPGIPLDIVPAPADCRDEDGIPVGQYCHLHLLRNPRVLDRIMSCLNGDCPAVRSTGDLASRYSGTAPQDFREP